MLNQIILAGKVVKLPELENNDTNLKSANITISIPRNFKNSDGEYETDIVSCKLLGNIAQNCSEYLKVGDIIGVKGRIQQEDNNIRVVAEKVSFLSSTKDKDNELER